MEVIASLIYSDDDDDTDLHIDKHDGFDDDHGKNLSHHHHHTDHHILHQDNSRPRVKARAGNSQRLSKASTSRTGDADEQG